MTRGAWSVVLVAVLAAACSGSDGGGTPASPSDSGVDAGIDAGVDAGVDAGPLPDAGFPDSGVPDGGTVRYTVLDLGDLGGGTAEAHAINSVGQVVGRSVNDAGVDHAFLWQRGLGMIDLGRLGTLPTNDSEANAINSTGEVVGVAFSGANTSFLWRPDTMVMVGLRGQEIASGINELGQIVGVDFLSVSTAFIREVDGGTVYMPHLGTQGGNQSYANAINSQGQVVGGAQTDTAIARAFLWDGATDVRDLGSLLAGDTSVSLAIAMNDVGQVVGYAQVDATTTHAFLWTSVGGMEDLGSLGTGSENGSQAWGVNSAGTVVGKTGTAGGLRGFVWTKEVGMVDLNTLVPAGTQDPLVIAQGINDSGEIVGTSNGFRALLFTPVQP